MMKTEIESKNLLQRFGIATTNPQLATDAQQAAVIAQSFAHPFAMKVVSAEIVHKAYAGGVRLNVEAADAEQAYQDIVNACKASHPQAMIEGVLLEEMISGQMEIFMGARVDAEYDGVILLGHGGSGVEHGKPPAAMLAPLDRTQARQLIGQAFAAHELARLGGDAIETLTNYLLAVAGRDGMLAQNAVVDLDINPIIVSGSACIAVDAVAQFWADSPKQANAQETKPEDKLDARSQQALNARRARLGDMAALFDPHSIAFIGASTSPSKLGYRNIKNLADFGFKGDLYPVHPTASDICGYKAYPSILDIPGPVDRAYIALGAKHVPSALADCASKGVKVVQVLTAGFTEWSGPDATQGQALEDQIKKVLAHSTLRMVGPNCIGTFSAQSRVAMGAARYSPTQARGITFISQSGTFAGDVVRRAQVQGIPVAQVLSCGNCFDLDIIDYLLFCEDDPKTDLIAFYVESIRDAGLFFRAAAAARKPIVILKGGTTEQGIAAAGSHTAALATDKRLWDAAVRQSGVLQVDSIDDLMDTLLMHSAHGSLHGNRLGIFGSGGGVSVTSTDTAARVGMAVPTLSPSTGLALQRFGVPGTSVANPIDIPVWGLRDGDRLILADVIDLLKADQNLDSLIVYIEMGSIMDFADTEDAGRRELEQICESVAQARRDGPQVSLVLRSTGDATQDDFVRIQRVALLNKGIAVFSSTSRAVRAHAKLRELSRKQNPQA